MNPNMSSIHEIDPRLRDTLSSFSQSQPPTSFAQLPTKPVNSVSNSPSQHNEQQYHPPPRPHAPPAGDQSPYRTHTPQPSSNTAADLDGADASLEGGPDDPKRPRACEACRGLKVRCEPGPNSPDVCKRCHKAGRQCIVTMPSRKRQKKTDSRVAELEKKIDALTASLHAKSVTIPQGQDNGPGSEGPRSMAKHTPYQQVGNGSYGHHNSPYVAPSQTPQSIGDEWSPYGRTSVVEGRRKDITAPMVIAGQKRKFNEVAEYPVASESSSHSGSQQRRWADGRKLHDQISSAWASDNPDPQVSHTHEYADVIDRGIVTADMSVKIFNYYVEKMAPHLPGVVFPADTPASKVRKESPTLFLAILAVGSGPLFPDLQRILTKEVMTIYANRIIMSGDKSLELIQAIHISTLWYWPPEHFEELKFYQLIHIAAVMALDIGMGKSNKPSGANNAGLFRDNPWRKQPYPDPESVEARRAWLTCYFLCCNAAMGLRRPNMIRWSSFMESSVQVLETSPDAAPTDKMLCQWVRSQHIAEEIGERFSMDDPGATVSISDPKVHYALKGFEADLEKWHAQVPLEARSPTLKMSEHAVNLYMHEIAMHVDHNVEEFKPPFTVETLSGLSEGNADEVLTSQHIAALSACLQSIDSIFETFLGLDVETVRCLPVANFVRAAYAVVVLIKMYFAASTPNSGVGKVFNKDVLKVEEYIDGLVSLFSAASAENRSRPSAKFLMVLVMLKTWFHRQKNGKAMKENPPKEPSTIFPTASEGTTPSFYAFDQNSNGPRHAKKEYGPANTPLQLLSEVATGNSGVQPRGGETQYPGSLDEWQSYQNYGGSNPTPQQNIMSGSIDPSLGLGLDDPSYTGGFDQVLGITLGGFNAYLSDDAFFAGMMGGNAPGFDGF